MPKSTKTSSDLYRDMSPEAVQEWLVDFPETATTALRVLRHAKYPGDSRLVVATALALNAVPIPRHFPCSEACVKYGIAIAKNILRIAEIPVTKQVEQFCRRELRTY